MNQPADYTHLESLFLFQSLLTHGVDNGAFARISEQLTNNALIKEAESYDPARLSPDALRHLFLLLLQEELRSDAEKTDNVDGVGSPGSRKRKLGSPPLPTLKDVYENVEKVPVLVDRLYARYRDHIVEQIREDEAQFEQVQKDILQLERTDRERRAARVASQNGTPVLAPREVKPAVAPNRPSPTPAPTPVATPATAIKRGPTPQTPVLPPKPPTHVPSPSVAPPSHLPAGATPIRPTPSPKPPNGTGSVLQAPAGVPQAAPRPLQAPLQPPKQAISPRPEAAVKAKDGSVPAQPATPAAGALKWEKPYQPPQTPQTAPPRQFQSPVQQAAQPVGQQHLQQQHPQHPQLQQQQLQQQQQWYAQQQHAQFAPQVPGQPGQPQTPQAHAQAQAQYQHLQRPQISQNQQQAQIHQAQQHPQHQQLPHQQQPAQVQHPHPPQYPKQPYPQQAQHHPRPQQGQHAQSPPLPQAAHLQQQQRAQQQPQAQPQQPRQQGKPVLVPPQAGQLAPPLQPAPPRQADAKGVQPPVARPTSTTPVHPPTRPIQPPQTQAQQAQHVQQQHPQFVPRPIASASPTPPVGATGPIAPPQQRWPQPHPQQQLQGQQPPAASMSPSPAAAQKDKGHTPHVPQAPRPGILSHLMRTVLNTPKKATTSTAPQTPVSGSLLLTQGLGTRWTSNSTPSTPKPLNTEPESPAFEAMSPPHRSAVLPDTTPRPATKNQAKSTLKTETSVSKPLRGRSARGSQKGRGPSATPSLTRARRSQSILSQTEEPSIEQPELAAIIKHEDATPKPTDDTGDTTADESVPGRPSIVTPSSVSSRLQKRKRQETPSEVPPPTTHVLWTRGFTKVSSSALDQISSHRDANMFATALREKDAPNYRQIVLQPQDITSIRSAIKHGNKAAVHAAQSLPGGDPGTAHVWLPVSKELVPPKGIINSAQLERELVHMFCNAIMYNPDPDRGPGEGFIKRDEDEEEEVVGYRLDENGVVKNTRSMFVEVEKLLGDLRSAEKERSAPPPSVNRPASVATPAEDTPVEDDDEAGDGEGGSGAVKRRRITRG